jgi:uncharacterized protein (DUF2225 family)
MDNEESKNSKISFYAKDTLRCPCCNRAFHREELRSGSGRLIADDLTDELHRLYKPSAKYGEIFPLAYEVTVCPQCWFAAMGDDFTELPPELAAQLRRDEKKRKEAANLIFSGLNFEDLRGLVNGAASLYLAASCYDYFPPEFSPTIKQGINILRCAWLLDELDRKNEGQHYDWLATLFKRKAQFFYSQALQKETSGKESLSAVKFFGPDTDRNYGYEGVLYLKGVLLLKYGNKEDEEVRHAALEDAKHTIARIFGIGKASKGKPGPLLENVKELYNNLNAELGDDD